MARDTKRRLRSEEEVAREATTPPSELLTFSLHPRPPFRLDLTAWALRRRPDNAVDRWDGREYRRTIVLEGEPLEVAVDQLGPVERPRLQVAVRGRRHPAATQGKVSELLERMLGLQIDLEPFYNLVADDPDLGPLSRRFSGLKPPRFPSLFEAVANGIACQQVTLTQGIRALNRLAESYGLALPDGGAPPHAFPRAEDLAGLEPEGLRALGITRQKSRALVELAESLSSGRLDLEELQQADDQEALDRLTSLRGVGRWTAEYVLLRGLGRIDVFPGDDVGARNNLTRWLSLASPPDYAEIQRLLGRWSPYQGFIYFHLLMSRLEEAGFVS